jgi:hypothetical protein
LLAAGLLAIAGVVVVLILSTGSSDHRSGTAAGSTPNGASYHGWPNEGGTTSKPAGSPTATERPQALHGQVP